MNELIKALMNNKYNLYIHILIIILIYMIQYINCFINKTIKNQFRHISIKIMIIQFESASTEKFTTTNVGFLRAFHLRLVSGNMLIKKSVLSIIMLKIISLIFKVWMIQYCYDLLQHKDRWNWLQFQPGEADNDRQCVCVCVCVWEKWHTDSKNVSTCVWEKKTDERC